MHAHIHLAGGEKQETNGTLRKKGKKQVHLSQVTVN